MIRPPASRGVEVVHPEHDDEAVMVGAPTVGPPALCPGPDWAGLRGMGNILRHAYHRTEDEAIWKAITLELSPLKQTVTKALANRFEGERDAESLRE